MKTIFVRTLTTLMIVYSIVLLTACPAASLQKAHDSSAKIAKYANAGVNLTRSLYQSQVISIDQKDAIARKFILLADGGIAFDAAVAKAKQVYGPNAPASEVQRIFALFDTEVIGKFLDILQSLKLINSQSAFLNIIAGIRAAVLVVAGLVGQKAAVVQRIEAIS